jgi:hypothetical protein
VCSVIWFWRDGKERVLVRHLFQIAHKSSLIGAPRRRPNQPTGWQNAPMGQVWFASNSAVCRSPLTLVKAYKPLCRMSGRRARFPVQTTSFAQGFDTDIYQSLGKNSWPTASLLQSVCQRELVLRKLKTYADPIEHRETSRKVGKRHAPSRRNQNDTPHVVALGRTTVLVASLAVAVSKLRERPRSFFQSVFQFWQVPRPSQRS